MPAGLSLSNIQKGRNLAELYFVRHGQASSGTDNYDRLSPVGEQQGLWLGEYFAERKITFDRVVIGAMQRHRQTADAILRGLGATLSCEQDLGLNEYDFHALYAAAGDQYPELQALSQGSQRDFYKGLKQVLILWSEGRLGTPAPESWAQFQQRVAAVRQQIQARGGKRVLVVSSGGPMASFTQQVLNAPVRAAIELNLQVRNTGFCHFFFNADSCHLTSFNSIPHLDRPARLDLITYG